MYDSMYNPYEVLMLIPPKYLNEATLYPEDKPHDSFDGRGQLNSSSVLASHHSNHDHALVHT